MGDDPEVTHDDARAWSLHTEQAFGLRVFGGGHLHLVARQQEIIRMIPDRAAVPLGTG
ncbi:hypothetical protein [Streptomyces pratensis]|uniref:hypothetical protein n=1 Tax=Streptomyces pratensis TaxID=1169025 RepID=UPI0036393756